MIETPAQLSDLLADVDAGMENLQPGHTWHMTIRGSRFTAAQLLEAAAGLKFCAWKMDAATGEPLRVQNGTSAEFGVWLVRQ